MPRIALQDVLIPHEEFVRDMDACVRSGISPIRFGLIPFSDEITSDDDLTGDAVPFGSVKLARLWQQRKTPKWWRIFYDEESFDQRTWMKELRGDALNGPTYAREEILGVLKNTVWNYPIFVKPTSNLKSFPGVVIPAGETIASVLASSMQDANLTDWESIIWAPRQEIVCEFRCWMYLGEMFEASRYKTGLRRDARSVSDEEREALRSFTRRMARIFQPADFYVVDIALMPDGSFRVVE